MFSLKGCTVFLDNAKQLSQFFHESCFHYCDSCIVCVAVCKYLGIKNYKSI